MAPQVLRVELTDARTTEQRHRSGELAPEHAQHAGHAGRSAGGETDHPRAADEAGSRPEAQRLDDV